MSMFAHPFVQYALLAGTAVALISGFVGHYLVVRAEVFATDALSHVGYTGALAALAAGLDLRVGLFAATVAVGALLALLGDRVTGDDTVIGVAFAWVLGLGVLFLSLFTTHRSTTSGTANTSVLFGSLFGLDRGSAFTALVIAVAGLAILAPLARPLLFVSIDPVVAAARGVPGRLVEVVFLSVVGAATAEATQVVGALLLLGLVAAPAAAAAALARTPWVGLGLSMCLAVASVWIGVTVAFYAPVLPVSFTVVTSAAVLYAGAATARSTAGRRATVSATPWPDRPAASSVPGTARTPRACD